MGETAKRVVESTNVPQAISALRGRVELAEGQLHSVADKSFRSLEEELNSVRSEVWGVHLRGCVLLRRNVLGVHHFPSTPATVRFRHLVARTCRCGPSRWIFSYFEQRVSRQCGNSQTPASNARFLDLRV